MQEACRQNIRQDFGEKFRREAEDVAGVRTNIVDVVVACSVHGSDTARDVDEARMQAGDMHNWLVLADACVDVLRGGIFFGGYQFRNWPPFFGDRNNQVMRSTAAGLINLWKARNKQISLF
jgi:hypothetical protein